MNSREHSQILRSTNIHSLGHNCRDRCTYLGIALTVSANPPDRECAVWHKSSAVPTTVPTVQVSMTLYSTSIDTVPGGTMKRQSTRTNAASLHKVDQRYERRKRPACTARLRAFRYLDRLLTPPSRRVTARRRLREHSRASAKP